MINNFEETNQVVV